MRLLFRVYLSCCLAHDWTFLNGIWGRMRGGFIGQLNYDSTVIQFSGAPIRLADTT